MISSPILGPSRLRQVHLAAPCRRSRYADDRKDFARWQTGHAAGAGSRHGVSVLHAVSVADDFGECRLRSAREEACRRANATPSCASMAGARRACKASRGIIRSNSPAACSSARRSRARLANGPEILLLDEPFGALDNQTRALMQELLLGIWERERKTVLFVTHDIEESIFLASRVLVMSARPGRIKADVRVTLPYPRHYTIKTSPEFSELKARLTEEIRAEAVLAAEAH